MSESNYEECGGATRQTSKQYPDRGRKVWVEEYPGGDMQIELGHIDNSEELYLSSEEAEALREAFNELEENREAEQ